MKIRIKKKNWKRIGISFFILFLLGNFVVYNHAYKFTHFVESNIKKTKKPEELSFGEKLNTLFFGINVPKPVNQDTPNADYHTINIESDELLEAWQIDVPNAKGTISMFHGYSGSKSSLLSYSDEFNKKGFSTLLVDFRGSGGSSGNTTTIGFKESKDVVNAFEYCKKSKPDTKIVLFGPSMGAVAIMKAIEEYKINPDKIILECPFGSMLTTTQKRFDAMGLPSFPFAELILFYGGLQTGFNAFKHKPIEYAKKINIPTLLMYGAKDARVSRKEIDSIYKNLPIEKKLVILENSAHEIYLNDDEKYWNEAVDKFLEN